jgi:hypothetical protein
VVEVAGAVKVLEAPVLLDDLVTSGRLAVMMTSSPRADGASLMRCYAVLTSWRGEPERVGMLVTFLRLERSTVNLVYADPSFRAEGNRTDGGDWVSAAVLVGRWLFGTGRLRKHSEDRNDAGDRWARAVGGHLPARDESGPQFDSEYWGARFLACVNGSTLPPFPSSKEPG